MVDAGLSRTFQRFFDSEKSGGILLAACTAASLLIANSPLGQGYLGWWQIQLAGLSLEHWINDALMAVFFLLIGLELEREIYSGELSTLRGALLPLIAAIGGIVTPALIHFSLNAGTPTQAGIGIPMATDIAFALGVLAVLGIANLAFAGSEATITASKVAILAASLTAGAVGFAWLRWRAPPRPSSAHAGSG